MKQLIMKPPYTPELLPIVQMHIEAEIKRLDIRNVLEFGAGYSTIWFAQQGCRVVTVEHDQHWIDQVERVAREITYLGDIYCNLRSSRLMPITARAFARHTKFDLALVDCIDDCRLGVIEAIAPYVPIIIVDDIHWDMLKPAFDLLSGRPRQDFEGQHLRKDGDTHFHKTSIFFPVAE
jgi:predicted O-methyltransferase YrrM